MSALPPSFCLRHISGTLSGAALILAAVGIHGFLAHSVGQRTHEIGLRVAIAARSADILLMVLDETAALIATGAALHISGALGASLSAHFIRQRDCDILHTVTTSTRTAKAHHEYVRIEGGLR